MTLTLPANYVEVAEDEMMYLDGGTATNFYNNMKALLRNSLIKKISGMPSLAAIGKMTYSAAMIKFPALMGKIASLTGNPAVIAVAVIGAAAAAAALWNKRIFY